MAQALPAGSPIRRRRAMMGLLDADGWGWASVKALFWFLILIFFLAYLPDRAYYLTVNRTVDLGLLAWSPVNLCPPDNKTLPCPAPVGAVIPWEAAPDALTLPAPRAHASAAQLGTRLLLVGGSDGTSATTTTFIANLKKGAFDAWTEGPALPEARSGASLVVIGSTAYLLGGADADGKPTDTVWALSVNTETSELETWVPVEGLKLPEPRSGASAVSVSDGLVIAGGRGADGAPTASVWKATISIKSGKSVLGAFEKGADLLVPVADASLTQVGDYLWLLGGSDAKGPVGAIQRGTIATVPTPETPAPNATPAPLALLQWAVADAYNLPAARTSAAGFGANGTLYVVGGDDGKGPTSQLYWSVPNGNGTLSGWKHLDQTDLPAGLEGGSPLVFGSTALIIGGTTRDGTLSSAVRANLAPQEPFFQAGLVGLVVPALKIDGEIGQQLGYLNAAGVGTVNGIILLLIGWAYNHKPQVRAWVDRRRGRRRS
ncbi:MAG: kelch repeat-containing protein [Candidatus Limnocylindrales bacterium]